MQCICFHQLDVHWCLIFWKGLRQWTQNFLTRFCKYTFYPTYDVKLWSNIIQYYFSIGILSIHKPLFACFCVRCLSIKATFVCWTISFINYFTLNCNAGLNDLFCIQLFGSVSSIYNECNIFMQRKFKGTYFASVYSAAWGRLSTSI